MKQLYPTTTLNSSNNGTAINNRRKIVVAGDINAAGLCNNKILLNDLSELNKGKYVLEVTTTQEKRKQKNIW